MTRTLPLDDSVPIGQHLGVRRWRGAGTGLLALLSASCGADGDGTASVSECPAASSAAGVVEAAGDPVEAITAEFAKSGAQLEDGSIVESSIEDRNFAGVYWADGDVVVAVVDCAAADVATVRALAGRVELRVIQVDHSFGEVDAFRDQLAAELRSNGVPGDVVIDSTTEGRLIEVRVLQSHGLPADFGSSVPAGTFSVREVDDLFRDV